MVDQDPHSQSVAGDSGHGTMAVTPEDEPVNSHEELVGAMGGMDENVSTENLSDVEWKEDDPLIKINDENVTIPQIPDAALTLVLTSTENNKFITGISPWKEALLQGVDQSASFKGNSSTMFEA